MAITTGPQWYLLRVVLPQVPGLVILHTMLLPDKLRLSVKKKIYNTLFQRSVYTR